MREIYGSHLKLIDASGYVRALSLLVCSVYLLMFWIMEQISKRWVYCRKLKEHLQFWEMEHRIEVVLWVGCGRLEQDFFMLEVNPYLLKKSCSYTTKLHS